MRLLVIILALLLAGADCEPAPPDPPPGPNPKGGTDYCHGLEYTILDSAVSGVKGIWNTIIGGEESSNRRATVQVFFGNSYCSGVLLSPHTVLTAGHCGYGGSTAHTVRINGVNYQSTAENKVVHPEYLKYINSGNTYFEGRKADLMLLYTDESMPGPYISAYRIYTSDLADKCYGLIAQGWGRGGEPGTLNEAKYKITEETDKMIKSVLTDVGKICFGDSGGPLYADAGPGQLYLAGITSVTYSADCLTGGAHVKVANQSFNDWIWANARP